MLILGACSNSITDRDIRYTSLTSLRSGLGGVTLIDPRSEARFAQGHIPGAINLSIADVRTSGPQDPRIRGAGKIVVYGAGRASALARAMAKKLMSVGFGDVEVFDGGLAEWSTLYEVETRTGG